MRRPGTRFAGPLQGVFAAGLSASIGTAFFVAAAVIFIFVLMGGTAAAQAPAEQGWWTTTNPGNPVGLPASPPSAAPDVPSNGLLVEGGASASSPSAYAALSYELPPGSTANTLTLSVASDSASTPNSTLKLCPLTNTVLNSEQGGPMSDAPAYDCTHKVTAQASSSGDTYQFDVSSLESQGHLAVAILPASVTDRVAFSQPGDNSLTVEPGSSSTNGDTGSGSSSGGTGSLSLGFANTGGGSGPASFGATGSPTVSSPHGLPSSGTAPSQGSSSGTSSTSRSSLPFIPPISGAAVSTAKPLAVGLVIALAVGGAAAWSAAGRSAIRTAAAGRRRPTTPIVREGLV